MIGTKVLFRVVSDDLIFISEFYVTGVCGAKGNRFLEV